MGSAIPYRLSSFFLQSTKVLTGVICLSTLVWAGAGTSGGQILNMGAGARSIAMGEAFTALADDVNSLYWNPAGMGIMSQSQASFMYNQSFREQKFNNLAVATPLENGAIGGALAYQSFGSIEGYDRSGNPTSDVNAYSAVGTFGAAWYDGGALSAGANLKGVTSVLADERANGLAADLGVTYTHQKPILDGTLRSAAAIRNLGTGLKFTSQRDPFPVEWRLGLAAVQMMDRKLNASVDFGKQRDVPWSYYVGTEYWVIPMIALRAGYVGTDQEGNGLRAGLGLRMNDFGFDYAYSNYGTMGMSHRYELSMRFGAVKPLLSPEERAMYRRAKVALKEGRYEEAALIMNSLIDLVPAYRPFQKRMLLAIRGVEHHDKSGATQGSPVLVGRSRTDPAMDQADSDELTALLQLDENAAVAKKTANGDAVAPMLNALGGTPEKQP